MIKLIADWLYPFARPPLPEPKLATGFFTDTTLCIGCKACEVACKQWNQIPSDGFQFSGNSYDNSSTLSSTTWRHVKFIEQFQNAATAPAEGARDRWLMMSDVCKHCSGAPCEAACPTGALITNEYSNVYIQNDICNGCGYCVAVCPFGVITRGDFDGHAHKCTLCYDRQRDDLIPACAKSCPTGSIQFGYLDDLRERATARLAEVSSRGFEGARLYGDEASAEYPELNSFFLLLDAPSVYGLPDSPKMPQRNIAADSLRAGLATVAWLAIVLGAVVIHGV
jgi:formate dehydrogenase iron-sulfur subunit